MIKMVNADFREHLGVAFGRKPTVEELLKFEEYVSSDIHEWLKDNAKSFTRNWRKRLRNHG